MPSDFIPILSKEELPKEVAYKELPKDFNFKRGEIFCPYCGNTSEWKKDAFKGALRCPYCGMSDSDFWVKTINKRWGGLKTKRK